MTNAAWRIKKNMAKKQRVQICLSVSEFVTVIILGMILGQIIRICVG